MSRLMSATGCALGLRLTDDCKSRIQVNDVGDSTRQLTLGESRLGILSEKQKETLAAICETIQPPGTCGDSEFPPLGAGDRRIATLFERSFAERGTAAQKRLKYLLDLLDNRFLNGVIAGHWKPFAELAPEQQTEILRALANSKLPIARAMFQGIKQLTSFLHYGYHEENTHNPFWSALGYRGFAQPSQTPNSQLPIMQLNGTAKLSADVLVIGSGAGGGVVAAELAAAGKDVLVVEKGGYYSDENLPKSEMQGMRDLYEVRGSLRTSDLGFIVLAGSTLGGGTAVNWMTSLDPPAELLNEWANRFGFHGVDSAQFAESLKFVKRRIHVTTEESSANAQNAFLERGCRELGYSVSTIPRNSKGCIDCDFCGFGCRHGAKQDTRNTFLHDAVQHGARILVRATVQRILHQAGAVTGAELLVEMADGEPRKLSVTCNQVVVAAGAIHTPALLTRSGLTNPNIGANLYLHPVSAAFARYEEEVCSWKGAPQTRVSEQFADLDGDGYGFRLEVCPAHPGLWALGLPWQSGRHHRHLMEQLPYLANLIILSRDKYPGRVATDRAGQPVLKYRLHPYDAKHLMQGVQAALRVHRAAGAVDIYGSHNDCLHFDCRNGGNFEEYIDRTRQLGTGTNHFGLFCAHQMSSCRAAGSPKLGAVDPSGQSYEVKNLFVADGSVLPTSTGVNPMLTIMTTAHYLAQQIKAII